MTGNAFVFNFISRDIVTLWRTDLSTFDVHTPTPKCDQGLRVLAVLYVCLTLSKQ